MFQTTASVVDSLQQAFTSEYKPTFSFQTFSNYIREGVGKKLVPGINETLYFSCESLATEQMKLHEVIPKARKPATTGLPVKSIEEQRLAKLMEKSVLKDFALEKEDSLPLPKSKMELRKERKAKAQETAGSKWFDLGMKPEDIDEDTKLDQKFLQLRSYINPQKFMKTKQMETPKHFEMAHVVPQSVDFYSDGRSKGKMKSKHFVDELIEDQEFKKYAKRKYVENATRPQKKNKRNRTK